MVENQKKQRLGKWPFIILKAQIAEMGETCRKYNLTIKFLILIIYIGCQEP